MSLLIALIIGAIAGAVAGFIKRGNDFGLLRNIILGIAGGVLGHFLAPLLGVAETNFIGSLVMSTVGALLLLFTLDLLNSR